MSWSKINLVFALLAITLLLYLNRNFLFSKKTHPLSPKNDFYQRLDHALSTAQLQPLKTDIRDFQQQVEFYIQSQNDPVKVIFSTKKNPYWQVAVLQKTLKTAKINNTRPSLIDLSLKHPYATLQNH